MRRGYNNQTPFSSESGMSSTFFLFFSFSPSPCHFFSFIYFVAFICFPPITNNIPSHPSLSIDCIS